MANENVRHQGWVASLSNGETVFEAEPAPGEVTPWRSLVNRCTEEGIWITQLQLQRSGQTVVGIKGADGYCAFKDVVGHGNVDEHMHLRFRGQRAYYGIGSVVGDKVICTLINDEGQHWQDTRELASMRAHCQLKPEHARKQQPA